MLFTSLGYLLFLPCAAALYHLVPQRLSRALLLLTSYVFYLCWEPRFGLLLLYITVLSYGAGRLLARVRRRLLLAGTLVLGFAPLFFYKYYAFFCSLISEGLRALGLSPTLPQLTLLLPVGISFFTFQALGYVIDVYRGKLPPERDLLLYALFVAFFPQLSAGPIGRAPSLLPQLRAPRGFRREDAAEGVLLIAWGLFKKLLLADNLAVLVNTAYQTPQASGSWQLMLAAVCFALQLYCDFSGYSDLAVGSARLFGIQLMRNFDAPYLSTSVKEFWRRWHISLSSWFRDYLYFPLGGSRRGRVRAMVNTMVVFTVSGLWHGASLTFVVWGALNGLYQVAGMLTARPRAAIRRALRLREEGTLLRVLRVGCTFALICLSFVFFRADTLPDAVFILKRMALALLGRAQGSFDVHALGLSPVRMLPLAFLALLPAAALGGERLRQRLRDSVPLRTVVLFVLIAATLLFGAYGSGYDPQDFVYFKF